MQFTVVIDNIDIPGFSRSITLTCSTAMEAHERCYLDDIESGEQIIEIRDNNNQIVFELTGFVDPF
jgi:hypothetical protein